jgi:Fur family zinc uptake transcriptional regulator
MIAQSSHDHPTLTRNQSLVYDALAAADAPMSAYTILDNLRGAGLRAPLQVYRALDKLIEYGLIHRLESLNSFVACRQPDCGEHETVAFAICEKCKHVSEIADPEIVALLTEIAGKTGFTVQHAAVELRGLCKNCRLN